LEPNAGAPPNTDPPPPADGEPNGCDEPNPLLPENDGKVGFLINP